MNQNLLEGLREIREVLRRRELVVFIGWNEMDGPNVRVMHEEIEGLGHPHYEHIWRVNNVGWFTKNTRLPGDEDEPEPT